MRCSDPEGGGGLDTVPLVRDGLAGWFCRVLLFLSPEAYAALGLREYRVHARLHQPRHADDARPRLFLRRTGGTQERARDHDPELRFHERHDGVVGCLWVLDVI